MESPAVAAQTGGLEDADDLAFGDHCFRYELADGVLVAVRFIGDDDDVPALR